MKPTLYAFILLLTACASDPESIQEPADQGPDMAGREDLGSNSDLGLEADAIADADIDTPDSHADADAELDMPGSKGTLMGSFENTYYYLAEEGAHTGEATEPLYDRECNPVATVSASFANAACIEGSARLDDGRVINYATSCSCGGPCSFCWAVMNPATHPWGMGSRGNALEPLRSWAVDIDVIPHGTSVYVEEWDGLEIPSLDGLGGFVHDGCFRADDVGGGINGNHVDIFAGSRSLWQALENIFPTRTTFNVYRDSPRCASPSR